MGVCEMCGSENMLFKVEIESSILNVCKYCAKHGKIIANVRDKKFVEKMQKKREKQQKTPLISRNEIVQNLIEGFHEIIKKKREHLNLKQEDLAKKINEKLSIIHKIETGHFEPSINLARKIERFLKISIIEQVSSSGGATGKTESGSFTL